jgi:hypothetical protein
MTEDNSATTSSAPTDPSKGFASVAELGAKIVEQFGGADRHDILGRWIAYRIAELLRTADRGRTKAQRETAAREAAELITRLWSLRTAWPEGWPPRNAAALIERLTTPAPYWQPPQQSQSRWLELLAQFERLHMRESHLLFTAALLETDLNEDAKTLERFRSYLEADEVRTVASLTSRRAAAVAELIKLLDADDAAEIEIATSSTEALRQQLEDLAAERAALVREVLRPDGESQGVDDEEPEA